MHNTDQANIADCNNNIKNNYYYAISDTGTTGHFLSNNAPITNKKNGECINVGMPNGQTMSSSLTTALHHPKLSKKATTAHVFKNIQKSLISISKFCDDGCKCTFSAEKLEIHKNDELIMTGHRNEQTGLWEIPLPLDRQNEMNNDFKMKRIKDLVKYHHKTCFSPV